MQLNIANLTYTYPSSAEPALCRVSATLPQGWTGIVGDNGSGKTTLALLACGALTPDSGSILPVLVSHYCEQSPSRPPNNLEEFALAYDGDAMRLRRELRLDEDWAWRFETLSSGQQKRLQVACALWADPDVLVMDEPTNHVDASTRGVICAALRSFRGVGLLISHDRELLDVLCAQCLLLSRGRAIMRPGNYTQAVGQVELERTSAVREREKARRERDRVEREAQRRREAAARSESRKSLRGVAKGDSDAREKRGRYVISGQDGKRAKLSSRMESRLVSASERFDALRVEKRYAADIWVDARPSRRKVLLRLGEQALPLGGAGSLEVPALYIGNCDHIGLVGDNGSGKSTLVRKIVGSLPQETRFLYIPQEPSAGQERAALEALRGLASAERGRALSIIAQLNSEPERILEGGDVSPGEMRKLMLALGILGEPELIVMDEPTNHLDLGSTQALQRALASYPGTLLLVSHDARLVEAATSITWAIAGAPGGYKLAVS